MTGAIDSSAEWQECRSTVGRLDQLLTTLRQQGFTLVSILLTANALVTASNAVLDRTAASIVVMALLAVLFILDSYYAELLGAAVYRAEQLESQNPPTSISSDLSRIAKATHTQGLIQLVYALFVGIAAVIPVVTILSGPDRSPVALTVIVLIALAEITGMAAVTRYYRAVLKKEA